MFRRHSLLIVSLGAVVLLALSAFFAGTLLLYTNAGRERVRSLLNESISAGISGKLEVGRIDALSLSRVRAHDVKILAPDGVPAIEAERAEIEFDLWALFRGTPGWSRAVIDHCNVRVSEGKNGKINMEETFAARKKPGEPKKPEKPEGEEDGRGLDLRTMVTSDCKLLITGGELPTLRMIDLAGIMRVHVLPNGDTELRFDEYSGKFVEGLPTGQLDFRDVVGEVHTGQKRLLHFDGKGISQRADVAFALDISTDPQRVKIDATFPEVSFSSMYTRTVGLWSKLSPSLEINVHQAGSSKRDEREAKEESR